jgi:hypothetical protein
MQIRPVVASVVGKTSPTHWGQVLQLPHAYGVVEVAAGDAIARQRGVTILSRLTHELSDGGLGLNEIKALVSELVDADVATLAVLVPVGQVVYVVLRGGGAVYLRRGEKFTTLLPGSGEISGETQEGDVILVVSGGFAQVLPPSDVQVVFDHLTPVEVAEKLTLLLHEREGGEGGAALIFEAAQLFSPEEPEAASAPAPDTTPPAPVRVATGRLAGRVRSVLARVRHRVQPRFLLTIILVVLFLVSVIVGVVRQRGNVRAREVAAVVVEAQHLFDEGMALMDLNAVKGRERLSQAEGLLVPLTSVLSDRSPEGRSVRELLAKVRDAIGLAAHVARVTPALYYDVSLVKKGALATSFAVSDERIGVVDTAGQTVFDVTIPQKSGRIAAGGSEFGDASHITVYVDRFYVLTAGGIHLVRLSDLKTTPAIIKSDSEWGAVRSLAAFGGNLYVLDSGKGRIWKYVATETGFTERREYLNPDTIPDLSRATSMAIDGSVWVATADGKILRFSQGKEQTYVVAGLDQPFGSNIRLFTNDAQEHVYVLDPGNRRVVVLDKDGFYQAQYMWEEPFAPTDIAASEAHKLILLLADGKIYSVPLE